MGELSREQREKGFRKELKELREKHYITSEEYNRVFDAHEQHVKSQYVEPEPADEQMEVPESVISQPKALKEKSVKPAKPKKVKTKEQVRERNITWSLILGVVLLLISGLVVATSQWEQMGAAMKVFSISFVSLFFLGLSYVTRKYLRIEQTAFAFLTLGSLLVPIVILAIGYFELLGDYLSLSGQGRYILGILGAAIPLPLYIKNAFNHQSRLFVWISFIFLSLTVGFTLGALKLPVDAFYLLLMLFNAILLFLYHRFEKKKIWKLFIKEMPLYAQVNLILSTLLMLTLFENELLYSFNLFLTAGLYMAMVFVYRTKEYQFVFSVLFAYGVYQLVEHSPLQAVDYVIYASAGMLYLGFAYAGRHHAFMKQAFTYTSGVISFFAFIYVSYEGILLHAEKGSVLLLSAYLIVALNYGVLAYFTREQVFEYLTPVFIFAAAWQLWMVTEPDWLNIEMFLFVVASVMLLYLGLWTKLKWLQPIKDSSFYESAVIMVLCIGFGAQTNEYGATAVMLFLFGVCAYLSFNKSTVKEVLDLAEWAFPVSWLLALVMFYFLMANHITGIRDVYGEAAHLAFSGLVLLAVSAGLRKVKEEKLSTSTFYISQSTYALSIFFLLNGPVVEPDWLRSLILMAGIGVFTWLVLRSAVAQLWVVVSLTVLAFYVSLVPLMSLQGLPEVLLFLIGAPVLLIGIGYVGARKWPEMNSYFFWVAHGSMVVLICIILLEQTISMRLTPYILLVPIAVYLYSSLINRQEWKVKLFLYASFSILFFLIGYTGLYYDLFKDISVKYTFMITSIILSLVWYGTPEVWKRRIEWYVIPFSVVGLFNIIYQTNQLHIIELVPILAYVVLICFFTWIRKWSVVTILPLLGTMSMWGGYRDVIDTPVLLSLLVLSFALLMGIGKFLYSRLIVKKGKTIVVDSFTWVAFLYIPYYTMFLDRDLTIWLQVLPCFLLSIWLILNRFRWKSRMVSSVFETLGMFSIYPAYLLIMEEYRHLWTDLIHAELQVLPLIGVLVFLRQHTWPGYKKVMNHVQLGLLLGISAFLVVDAIWSHTIWDAWIIGSLSLISLIVGMQLRIKSYFFVGAGVLIFNVIYQTRPYWGNLPWWVYLLLSGLLLIGIASYNEWQKQKDHKPLEEMVKRIFSAFKKWN
ncbi:hypothetical protein [Halobacillus naozhouensis]|uniref:DUF2157 domain-containing protein n=1 Tax=Halobacillus naozhouensis TaxID=554880 RepID=A0ABY8IY42_9BACI|nr:hypothetical protein [Halobacillus naozhouensis]WFT75135.1 hypothetical protein P9989_01625 [Halobacillus naozhouensis]